MIVYSYDRICILWYCVVFVSGQRCSTKLGNGTMKSYCCDNQIEKNGKCVECDIGYISDEGEPCHQCRKGSFGKKCAELCSCYVHERCHHVFGCINITLPYTTAVEDIVERTVTPANTVEFIKVELVIYICCTASLILVILMFGLYRRRDRQSDINITETRNDRSTLYVPEHDDMIRIYQINERIYDMIDESQMIDMPSQHMPNECQDDERLSNETSSLEADENRNSGDGYLNPYQPMVHDLDHHAYLDP